MGLRYEVGITVSVSAAKDRSRLVEERTLIHTSSRNEAFCKNRQLRLSISIAFRLCVPICLTKSPCVPVDSHTTSYGIVSKKEIVSLYYGL